MMRQIPLAAAAAALAGLAAPVWCADASLPATGGMLQMFAGLATVVALIFGIGWLMRRSGATNAGAQVLRIVASHHLSTRERIVVVEVADSWLVVGVAPGQVTRLGKFAKAEISAAPAPATVAAENFSSWLARARSSLGGGVAT